MVLIQIDFKKFLICSTKTEYMSNLDETFLSLDIRRIEH